MQKSLFFPMSLWCVLAVLIFSACPHPDDGGSAGGPVLVESVTLSETAINLKPEATKQLSAAIEPPNAENKTLSWASATPGIATVSNSGLVTAVAVGATQIIVSAKDGSKKTAVCTVTVATAGGGNNGGDNQKVQVTSITISPATGGLVAGQTLQLTTAVLPANATDKTVTWSSSTPAVATVSSNGLVTGVTAGPATITAAANDGSGVSGTRSVTVTNSVLPPAPPAISITTSATGPFYPGGKIPVNAVINPIDPDNPVYLNWTSSNTAIATVERADNNLTAVITAVSPGTVTITAANQNSGGGSGTYPLTVIPVPVSSITLNHTSRELSLNGTFQLTASVGPENAADKTITWSVTSTPTGSVTLSAPTGPSITVTASAVGTATITAASGGINAACTVTVKTGSGQMIDFAGFDDDPIDLDATYIGDLSRGAYDNFTVTINNSSSYSSIWWYVDGQSWNDNSSYTIYAESFPVGTHDLTVVVQTSDGKSFSKKLSFRVVE